MSSSLRTALAIAGTDPTGGAGIGCDLRTLQDLGVIPLTAVTAVNAQNTVGFFHSQLVAPENLAAQLRALADDVRIDAIKIGMLGSAGQARAVADFLEERPEQTPVVVDPVLRSSSGSPLLDDAGLAVLSASILPRATVITPNREEAERLADGHPVATWATEHPAAVLVTGGDDGDPEVCDRLYLDTTTAHRSPRLDDGPGVRGTGCALSSAIAARLAHGDSVEAAIATAIAYVRGRIASAVDLGHERRVMVSAR